MTALAVSGLRFWRRWA